MRLGRASPRRSSQTSSENELADASSQAGIDLTAHQTGVLHGLLAGTDSATAALAQLPAGAARTVEQIAKDSFAAGVQSGFRFVAIAALLVLAISVLRVGRD